MRECQCSPWNFPKHAENFNYPMCTVFGNHCFLNKFWNNTHREECHCLPNCHKIHYNYHIDFKQRFTEAQIEYFCSSNKPHFQYIRQHEETIHDLEKLVNISMYYSQYYFGHITRKCKNYIKHQFARITLKINGLSHLKRRQSLKYLDNDKFAVIGGTLGLISGFSFIVVFELLYWIIVNIKRVYHRPSNVQPKVDE